MVLRVGRIDGDEEVVGKLRCDDAAFFVVFFDAKSVAYAERLCFAQNRGARVTLFLSAVPVNVGVSLEAEVLDEIGRNFSLL